MTATRALVEANVNTSRQQPALAVMAGHAVERIIYPLDSLDPLVGR
jgi:hypothetical protein